MLTFIQTKQLDETQWQDLLQLQQACKQIDRSTPNIYGHLLTQARVLPATCLAYEQKKLLGFLSIYFFYEGAVEISLLIHPLARRQTLAKQLLNKMLPLIQEKPETNLIFSAPQQLNDHWLKTLNFSYLHREYYMERNQLTPVLVQKHLLHFRLAMPEDIPEMCYLDESCFHKAMSSSSARFQQLLQDRDYEIILALQQEQIIGKAHLRWQAAGATFSDIAIRPHLQGQGLGTSLITHCINYCLSQGKPHLNLDVETHNQKALGLYLRLGFSIKNACDFWQITLSQLQQKLNRSD